jgi:drug/metabolite transporter (DMT)-like permease
VGDMKKYIYSALIAFIALVLLLFETDPRSINSVALVAPFVLIFLILFFIATYFLRIRGFARSTSWIMAAFIATLPTLLLVLQSIGQLTIKDVATLVALFVIAYFYVRRADSPANR